MKRAYKRKIVGVAIISGVILVSIATVGTIRALKQKNVIVSKSTITANITRNLSTTDSVIGTWDISENNDGSITATLTEDGTLTISGTGAMKSWNNSNEVPWYSVKSSMTKVTIENGVVSIGKRAFYECKSLTNITIPNSVTSIGNYAFRDCDSLTNITIQNSVISIGDGAFISCNRLEEIVVESNNEKYSSENGVLFNKDKTELICYPKGKVEKTYSIPDSVTSIGKDAFFSCDSLTNITIPNSVTSIGRYAFENCDSLTNITIPNSVTSIGSFAFYDCDSLTNITIPNSVTSIGDYVFYGCDSLINITIPDSVTSIGNNAFANCSSDLTICGYEGSYAETYASANNIKFQAINSEEATIMGTWDISENNDGSITATLTKDGTLTISGTGAMKGWNNSDEVPWYSVRSSITKVNIENGVTSIGNKAFYSCSSLTNITIPNSVTSIGNYAFRDCDSLTNITIPNSVTSIGSFAFYDCDSLTNITIPNSVTSIGDYVFYGCDSLINITIPDSVTSIGNNAFANCSSDLTICGYEGSYAETYASANNIKFQVLNNENSNENNNENNNNENNNENSNENNNENNNNENNNENNNANNGGSNTGGDKGNGSVNTLKGTSTSDKSTALTTLPKAGSGRLAIFGIIVSSVTAIVSWFKSRKEKY